MAGNTPSRLEQMEEEYRLRSLAQQSGQVAQKMFEFGHGNINTNAQISKVNGVFSFYASVRRRRDASWGRNTEALVENMTVLIHDTSSPRKDAIECEKATNSGWEKSKTVTTKMAGSAP